MATKETHKAVCIMEFKGKVATPCLTTTTGRLWPGEVAVLPAEEVAKTVKLGLTRVLDKEELDSREGDVRRRDVRVLKDMQADEARVRGAQEARGNPQTMEDARAGKQYTSAAEQRATDQIARSLD